MSAKITSFINDRIVLTKNSTISNKDLLEAYLEHTSVTTGRNSLYKQLEDMEGVSRTKTHFKGISFHVVARQTIEVAQPKQEIIISEYEQKLIEMKERKLAQQEKLEAQRIVAEKEREAIRAVTEKEREAIRAATDKEIADNKIAAKKEIEAKKIEAQVELKMIDVTEKEKDRAFMREENNKNRRMHMTLHHNKYLDFAVYGNPSQQYIERDSMINVLGFNTYHALCEHKPELLENIMIEAIKVSKSIPVYENASSKTIDMIEMSDAMKVIEEISKQADAPAVLNLIDNIEKIQQVAVADDCRTIPSRYSSKKSTQDKTKHASSKDKLKYLKAVNKLREQDGKLFIQCACCHLEIDLQSSGCHRAHDIPKADGGDWSADNVYLTCATCNSTMSDHMSVLDFKVDLYVKILEQQ